MKKIIYDHGVLIKEDINGVQKKLKKIDNQKMPDYLKVNLKI